MIPGRSLLQGFLAGIGVVLLPFIIYRLVELGWLETTPTLVDLFGEPLVYLIAGACVQGGVAGFLSGRKGASFGAIFAIAATFAVMNSIALALLTAGAAASAAVPAVTFVTAAAASSLAYACGLLLASRRGIR